MNSVLIIINAILFYLEDRNVYKCYTTVIDDLFNVHKNKKLLYNKIILDV